MKAAAREPTTWRHLAVSWALLVPFVAGAFVAVPLLWLAMRARRATRREA